jgi:hypothetical protein
MNDCPNAEIRDRLPDLLHDRLDVSTRAAVMAHVDDCVDCRAELELLKGVRGVMVARTPRVDINYLETRYRSSTRRRLESRHAVARGRTGVSRPQSRCLPSAAVPWR